MNSSENKSAVVRDYSIALFFGVATLIGLVMLLMFLRFLLFPAPSFD